MLYWSQRLDAAGGNVEAIIDAFANSPESQALYGTIDSNTIGNVVDKIYQALFGRPAEPAGKQLYVDHFNKGELTPGNIAWAILKGAQNDDLVAVQNKLKVANLFTEAVDGRPMTDPDFGVGSNFAATYVGNDDAATARAFLASVTSAPSTVKTKSEVTQEIQNNIADSGDSILNQSSGQTFMLTTNVDNITGTSGNDTINGVVDTTANGGTLGVADVIDGGAGVDTMNLTVTDNTRWAQATIQNVEKFFFRDLSTGSNPMNVSNISGATEMWSSKSTQDLELTNIANNVTLGLSNTAKNLTATFADGTFKAGSTLAVAVSNAGTNATTRSTVEVGHASTAGTATDLTLAVTAASGANFVEFKDGSKAIGTLKTLSIAGTGSVDLVANNAEFDNLTTVNASGNSGGVTLDLGNNAKDVTITGGSGDDTFVLPNFTDKDVVNGGAGNDTLVVTLVDAAGLTKAPSLTSIETLQVTGSVSAPTTLNADFLKVSNFVIDGGIGANLTLTNLTSGAKVQLNADSTAASDLTLDVKGAIAGSNDSLTIATDADGAALDTNAITVKVAGVETLNIVGPSSGTGSFKLGGITDAQLTTINVSGKGAVDLGTIAAAGVTTVNASGNSGGVTADLSNSTKAVTFTGGEGADTYTASTKGDTIYGGKGADTITLSTGADVLVYKAAAESTVTTKDTIISFDVTADLIKFDASLLKGTATYLGASAFTAGGSTELRMATNDLQVDFNGDGTADLVVTLTGVTSADFGATNFTFA